MTGFAEHGISGHISAPKENYMLGLFGWDSSPEMNNQKLDNSSSIPSVTYLALSD
jgi:hypothetical protein